MAVEFSFEERRDYFHVHVTGGFTVSQACDAFVRVAATIKAYRVTKVLVDCLKLDGNPSAFDRFMYFNFVAGEFAKFAGTGAAGTMRIAYVAAESLLGREFLVTVDPPHRDVEVAPFETTTEAIRWLTTARH